ACNAALACFVTLDGDFCFEKGTTQAGTSIIEVGVSAFHLALGDGNRTYVQVNGTQGGLLITDAGMAGSITDTLDASAIPGISLNNTTFTVSINNIHAAVNEKFNVAGK